MGLGSDTPPKLYNRKVLPKAKFQTHLLIIVSSDPHGSLLRSLANSSYKPINASHLNFVPFVNKEGRHLRAHRQRTHALLKRGKTAYATIDRAKSDYPNHKFEVIAQDDSSV